MENRKSVREKQICSINQAKTKINFTKDATFHHNISCQLNKMCDMHYITNMKQKNKITFKN